MNIILEKPRRVDSAKLLKKLWLTPEPSEQELLLYYLLSLEKVKANPGIILVVGRGELTRQLLDKCSGLNVRLCGIPEEASVYLLNCDIATVLTTYTDSETVHRLLKILYVTKKLESVNFIYKISQKMTYQVLDDHDLYSSSTRFIEGNFPYEIFKSIFKESLGIFEHKTQVKDALDFTCQLDRVSHISGDILELGSYRGHSGFILAQFQQQVCEQLRDGCEKKIFLCDTFEGFPEENLAIDNVWNNTHDVDFMKVKENFKNVENVKFVKGDICETLKPLAQDREFSFVFIDVDSYRTTKYSLETIYNKLTRGGVVVCQDYGKEHCIGARLAIDNFINNNKCLYSFSFYSGLKFIFKI
jgi:hypothetical protein